MKELIGTKWIIKEYQGNLLLWPLDQPDPGTQSLYVEAGYVEAGYLEETPPAEAV